MSGTGPTGGGERPRGGVQVEPGHYWRREYDSKERFISYWHQIDAVLRWQPQSVLEVGVGNGFVIDYLRRRVPQVWSVDHDPALRPSAAAALDALPLSTRSVDVVLCAEVLEHVPFETAAAGLAEFARVARTAVVLSVPNAAPFHRALLPIPFLGERRLLTRGWGARGAVLANPQEHYWELGLPDCPQSRLLNAFERAGLVLVREFRLFENPYHHFFELRPRA